MSDHRHIVIKPHGKFYVLTDKVAGQQLARIHEDQKHDIGKITAKNYHSFGYTVDTVLSFYKYVPKTVTMSPGGCSETFNEPTLIPELTGTIAEHMGR